ncbi:MAG: hypothetical protein Q9166_006802 [cf. Caloplaca sp. 2 TL-2023]
MHPSRIASLIVSGLAALDTSAAEAGGPFSPLNLSPIKWTYSLLAITVEDLTWRAPDPESAGGRFRYDELRAVYQGVGANIHSISNEECKIEIWRMATGGFPRRQRKVKKLGTGVINVAPTDANVGLEAGNKTNTE